MTIPTTHSTMTAQITTTSQTAAMLADVLELCEEFLRTPAGRAELADFCTRRPSVTSGWLIDMLALHALHLRARLNEAVEDHR